MQLLVLLKTIPTATSVKMLIVAILILLIVAVTLIVSLVVTVVKISLLLHTTVSVS